MLTCTVMASSVLFFITLIAMAYFIWSGRRARETSTTTPQTGAKVAEPTKDGIGMEHQTQPVPAPAPQYTAQQQPHDVIHHDQTGFQQTGTNFDHSQDPYQAMQPGFEQHHPTSGHPEHQNNNTYASV